MAVTRIPKCEIGLPGGSGTWAAAFPRALNRADAKVVQCFPDGFATPYGQSAPATLLDIGGEPVLRFKMHGWHQDNDGNPVHPALSSKQVAWCFMEAGVEWALCIASVGGIQNPNQPGAPLPPWSIGATTDVIMPWLLEDHGSPFQGKQGLFRVAEPFCQSLRQALVEAASQNPQFAVYDKGTYVCTRYDRLETAAEIKTFATWGAHIVGQTLGYEHSLMRAAGIHYGHMWLVSNHAEGFSEWVGSDGEGWADFYHQCWKPAGDALVEAVKLVIRQGGPKNCACNQYNMQPMDFVGIADA